MLTSAPAVDLTDSRFNEQIIFLLLVQLVSTLFSFRFDGETLTLFNRKKLNSDKRGGVEKFCFMGSKL